MENTSNINNAQSNDMLQFQKEDKSSKDSNVSNESVSKYSYDFNTSPEIKAKDYDNVDENNLNSPSSNSYNKYDQQDTKSLYLAYAKPQPASLGNIEAQSNDMLQFQIEDKNNNDNITSESFSKYSYDCKSSCEIEPGSFESGVDSFRGGW